MRNTRVGTENDAFDREMDGTKVDEFDLWAVKDGLVLKMRR